VEYSQDYDLTLGAYDVLFDYGFAVVGESMQAIQHKSIIYPSPAETVSAYLSAIAAREYSHARVYLADERFYYEDPVNRFDSADELIRYLEMVGPIIGSIDVLKQFTDGNEVCTILQFTAQLSEKTTTMAVQWALVRKGRIASIYGIYDAHEQKMLYEID
jgi:limonene-1,2-epoxide hydrolase